MERIHKGSPVIIICPPNKTEGINLFGNTATRLDAYMGITDENPLYLAFLDNERSVEVITEIEEATFKTRELTAIEEERFHEAYYGGECTIRVRGKETLL